MTGMCTKQNPHLKKNHKNPQIYENQKEMFTDLAKALAVSRCRENKEKHRTPLDGVVFCFSSSAADKLGVLCAARTALMFE